MTVFCRTFTALAKCGHCGGGLPLLGPRRRIACGACQGITAFAPFELASGLSDAAFGVHRIRAGISYRAVDAFPCRGCSAAIDVSAIATAGASPACPACHLAFPYVAPPAWLARVLPSLTAIYGAELDAADVPAAGTAIAAPAVARPVTFACPECGGRLHVTQESGRTLACEHCQATVFLPDELWRILHPVARALPWGIAWVGRTLEPVDDGS